MRFHLSIDLDVKDDGKMLVLGVSAVPVLPAAPTNLRATNVTAALVALAWDNLGDASSWDVYRDGAFLVNVVVPSYSDSSVADDTDYVYKVVAKSAAGDSELASNELLIHTSSAAPAAPTGLALSEPAKSRVVSLTWDNPGNIIEWDVRRDTVVIATVSVPGYVDESVSPATSYSYDLIARTATDESAPSAALAVTTPANATPEWTLANGTQFVVSVGDTFSLNLAQNCADEDGDDLSFSSVSGLPPGLVINGDLLTGSFTTAGSYAASTVRVSDGLATADLVLDFQVAALPDTTGPTAPVLQAPDVSGSTVSVDLATPSTDDSGIRSYQIWRSSDAGATYQFRLTIQPGEFPYVESGVADGSYLFKARARDDSANGNLGDFSDPVPAVVNVAGSNPDVPINFVANLNGADTASISWAPGPNGPAPTGYDLEYSHEADGGSATGPWNDFVVSGAVTSATDSNLPTGRTWYRIRALTATGASPYTSVISVNVGGGSAAADFIIETTDPALWDASVARVPETGGPARAVQAGDIIELAAGVHPLRTIRLAAGTASNPVTIRCPSSGQVIIRRPNSGSTTSGGYALTVEGCNHYIVDGFTTDPAVPVASDGKRHGIKLTHKANATPSNKDSFTAYVKHRGTSASGAGTYNVSRNCLYRYVHIDGGWAPDSTAVSNLGIGISTNDHNYKRADHPGKWQENMTLEHCLIENLGGEGTYMGPNPYMTVRGTGSQAGGADVPLRYIKTRFCMFRNIGGNGSSYKSVYEGVPGGDGPTDNSVHDCVFIACGLDAGANGTIACALNSARAAVYNCWFEDCGFGGVSINISEGTSVGFPGSDPTFPVMFFNNVIKNCGTVGSATAINTLFWSGANSAPVSYKARVRCFNNTILNHNGTEINTSDAHATEGFVRNNLLPGGSISYGPYPSSATNRTSGTPASTFVDAVGTYDGGNLDLRPSSALPATGTVGVGNNPSGWGSNVDIAPFDFTGASRGASPDIGAYQH